MSKYDLETDRFGAVLSRNRCLVTVVDKVTGHTVETWALPLDALAELGDLLKRASRLMVRPCMSGDVGTRSGKLN